MRWHRAQQKYLHAWMLILLTLSMLGPGSTLAQTQVIYVQPSASGNGDGSSWAAATTLRGALQRARAGDEIWVAAGVYVPGPNQRDTFTLVSGVALYGGFAGNETLRTQRDPARQLTVLSGDIAGDDINRINGVTLTALDIVGPNTCTVVTVPRNAPPTTILDGVTISGGQSGNPTGSLGCRNEEGGGLEIISANPTLNAVRVIGNEARLFGGGLYLASAEPVLSNLFFAGNWSAQGGGMYVRNSRLSVDGVTFTENRTRPSGGGSFLLAGGGMYLTANSEVTLRNASFFRNQVTATGGGIFAERSTLTIIGGEFSANTHPFAVTEGMPQGIGGLSMVEGTVNLTNVRFRGNVGGGLRIQGMPLNATVTAPSTLTNVSFSGNHFGGDRVGRGPGAIQCVGCRLRATNISVAGNLGGAPNAGGVTVSGPTGRLDLRNSIIWGNATTSAINVNPNLYVTAGASIEVAYSLIENIDFSGPGNIPGGFSENNPLFVRQPNINTTPSTDGDLRLRSGSPALDVGNNDFNLTLVDVLGNPRVVNATIDLGAYEFNPNAAASFGLTRESDRGVSDSDGVTNLNTPEFSGTTQPGATVVLSSDLDGSLGTTTADEQGLWRLRASTMRDGMHTLTSVINGVATDTISVSIDTVAPELTIIMEPLRGTFLTAQVRGTEDIFERNLADLRVSGVLQPRTTIWNVARIQRESYRLSILHGIPEDARAEIQIEVPTGVFIDRAGNLSRATSAAAVYSRFSNNPDQCAAIFAVEAAQAELASVGPQTEAVPFEEALDIELYYRLRNLVLVESEAGQRLIERYYAQSPEIVRLLIMDGDLRSQSVTMLQNIQPSLRALLNGRGAQVSVTAAEVQSVTRFLDALSEAGSAELQQAIATERANIPLETLVSQTVNAAIQLALDVDPTTLTLGSTVYLPLVTR